MFLSALDSSALDSSVSENLHVVCATQYDTITFSLVVYLWFSPR